MLSNYYRKLTQRPDKPRTKDTIVGRMEFGLCGDSYDPSIFIPSYKLIQYSMGGFIYEGGRARITTEALYINPSLMNRDFYGTSDYNPNPPLHKA